MTSSKKVLVVEDDSALREALREKLRVTGYEVFEAANGEQGLEVALLNKPDVILLDIVMPKMDGIEMAKRLREDEWGRTAKIMLLTNVNELDKVEKALEYKIFEYFLKSNTKLDFIMERVGAMLAE